MRIFTFSDVHWFRNKPYLKDTFTWLAQEIRAQAPDVVVFCGDMNHAHGYVDIDVLDAMSQAMREIEDAAGGCPIYMLAGNHDQASRDGSENILTAFRRRNVQCIAGNPEILWNGGGNASPWSAIGCAYPPRDSAEYLSVLSDKITEIRNTGNQGPIVLFTHWELNDIPYTPIAGKSSDHPVSIPNGVNLIVNGHYHHPVTYADRKPPVVIVGSPCYHNYSDMIVPEPRGYVIIGLENDGAWSTHRVANPYGPLYHTIESSGIPMVQGMTEADRSRLQLRVKVATVEEYEDSKATLLSLRETVGNLRVTGTTPKVSQHTVLAEQVTPHWDHGNVLNDILSTVDLCGYSREMLLEVGKRVLDEVSV